MASRNVGQDVEQCLLALLADAVDDLNGELLHLG